MKGADRTRPPLGIRRERPATGEVCANTGVFGGLPQRETLHGEDRRFVVSKLAEMLILDYQETQRVEDSSVKEGRAFGRGEREQGRAKGAGRQKGNRIVELGHQPRTAGR